MGFLSAYTGTTRVYVNDKNDSGDTAYWVELKKYISQGEKEAAEAALTSGKMVANADGTSKFEVEPNTAKYRQLMVFASIVAWNLDDDNGTVWPVTLANVRRLPGIVFDKLWKVVDDLGSPLPVEERRQFPDEGVGGDSDGDAGTTITGDVQPGS